MVPRRPFKPCKHFSKTQRRRAEALCRAPSDLSANLTALGSALSAGDLSTAQSAFASVLGDLSNTATPQQVNEATAASQSVQLVEELLSTVDSVSTSSSSSDLATSILQSVYASQSGLDVYA